MSHFKSIFLILGCQWTSKDLCFLFRSIELKNTFFKIYPLIYSLYSEVSFVPNKYWYVMEFYLFSVKFYFILSVSSVFIHTHMCVCKHTHTHTCLINSLGFSVKSHNSAIDNFAGFFLAHSLLYQPLAPTHILLFILWPSYFSSQ